MTEYKRIFVDTAPIIYYLENSSLYNESIKSFFKKCIEEKIKLVTSTVTVEEYLAFPYANGNIGLVDNFKRFVEYMNMEIVDVDFNIAEEAAKIRGRYKKFKSMDALQLATAVVSGCDAFFTNDKQLRQENENPCITMEDL